MYIIALTAYRYNHNFEHAHFEHDRIDAMAMERLTSSPHVINIYGFCGRSVITEFADGPRLGTLADKSKKYPLKRLAIARDIASALSDVHRIDGDERATFAHLDINPANVVVIDNTLKLNDFNIGVMIKYNISSHSQCGFPSQYPNPQWRSPEEAAQSLQLTEKVDVFSLGHIFFRLICGHEPWNKLEKGGKPSSSELTSKVKAGKLPRIPEYVLNTKDPEIKAILEAMLACYTSDPTQRPSSREIVDFLDNELKKLSASK
jgi:serine/threonine protein kinase